MNDLFLECGKIVGTHGIRGELRVQSWCDTPDILTTFDTLYLAEGATPLPIVAARVHKNVVILQCAGIDTIEGAQALVGQELFLLRADFPLEEGRFFVQDLVGCAVWDQDQPNLCYGTLTEVTQTGANDIYHIKTPAGGVVLVPVIPEVVRTINPAEQTITITPLAGLFE